MWPAHPKSKIQNYSPAFTLVELLVSMAILSGLIVLLFSVVDSTTQVWNKSEQRVDAFREARAALFVIARDLQTMVPAPDVSPFDGAADFKFFFVNPSRTGTTDVTFSGVANDTYGDRLFFLTAQSATAQTSGAKSDVCSVGYYLDYTAPASAVSGTPSTFKLYRYFAESDRTFSGPSGTTGLKAYAATPPTTTVLMQANSTTDEVLARNVVDFRVVAYDKDMKSLSPWDAKATPYAVDLSITAYNYSVANRLTTEAAWQNNTTTAGAKQTFATRVYLARSGPTPTPTPTP